MLSRRTTALAIFVVLTMGVASVGLARPTEPELPPVTRRIPEHPFSILDGCNTADRALIEQRIGAAIEVGAPAYNSGNFRLCYETYAQTAQQIERELPARCAGPARALRDGRQVAQGRADDAARAWAMRDAFDGLLLVIARYDRR